ncbi:hypothetical protein CBL_01208 [Carabus blaptoides fortunei]
MKLLSNADSPAANLRKDKSVFYCHTGAITLAYNEMKRQRLFPIVKGKRQRKKSMLEKKILVLAVPVRIRAHPRMIFYADAKQILEGPPQWLPNPVTMETMNARYSCRRHPERRPLSGLRSMAVGMTLAVTAGENLDLPQLTGTTATLATVPLPSVIATCSGQPSIRLFV